MKKGFTLIELLAVIIILAIIALIATPIILNVIGDARKSAGLSESEMIMSGINNYCETSKVKNQLDGSIDICADGVTVEEVSQMVNLGNAKVLDVEYVNEKLLWLQVESNNNIYSLNKGNMIFGEIDKSDIDLSGANEPKLYNNMVPIKYDGSNWIYADTNEIWYNYDKKEWANAVVLNSGITKNVGDIVTENEISLWYVWIPRYTYTIFNGNNEEVSAQIIDIEFESGTNSRGTVKCVDNVSGNGSSSETCTDITNGSIINGTSTYTHPAFTFGNEQLTGFWVGKFEVSGTTNLLTIKPGVSSLRNQTLSSFFNAIKGIEENYNINGDSHVIRNMEWGAVAYLKQSQYGLGEMDIDINNNGETYYTGGGTDLAYKSNIAQSTTGNIYGVYDMNGNAWEYTTGNMVDTNGDFYSEASGFSTLDTKYYDKYSYANSFSVYTRGKLGDATKEILTTFNTGAGGWYSDASYFVFSNHPWFGRGGNYDGGLGSGIFVFGDSDGGSYNYGSSRAVLS